MGSDPHDRDEGSPSSWAGGIAREAIRDLVARYNQLGDRGRIEALLALFAPEATLEIVPGRVFRGRDEIRTLFDGAVAQSRSETPVRVLRHFTATHQIDLLGERAARGRCDFAVLTEAGLDRSGQYLDEYALHEERWRFAARKVVVDGQVHDGRGARTARRGARTARRRARTAGSPDDRGGAP